MKIKGLTDEDFVNYKLPSMYICTSVCGFKCDKESGENCCQNSSLAAQQTLNVEDSLIIERYINNPITKAICFAGLEPLDQFDELLAFIKKFRVHYHRNDTIVIYTGYNKSEVSYQISELMRFNNIVMKYGRFVPNQQKHFDDVLGVYLASDNQFAEVLC